MVLSTVERYGVDGEGEEGAGWRGDDSGEGSGEGGTAGG